MDDLERLLLAHRMQQQSGGMMQRPLMGGPMQPSDAGVTGIGPMPEMQAPFGSQVKDYLAAGSGALGGAGLAAGMGQGIARPLMQGVGGAFAKQQAPDLRQLLQMAAMGAPRGAGANYNMPMQGPGIAGPAAGATQSNPANQGALT